ncbi:MAG: PKD domain-containing protein [Acidobacteriota bacterium]|nr:PKD domain-containing protein [Acidobacteriota bacterium]
MTTALALGTLPVGSPGAAAAASTVTLSPITATFVPAEFATHYTVHATDTAGLQLTYRWVLVLELVDPAGSVNPSSGSHAAVDLNCNNQGKLTSKAPTFVWKHGDASLGGCDHSKMGPSGHQGKILLAVSDGRWVCTASYGGTNTGVGGAATCMKVAPNPPASGRWTCRGATTKLFDNWNGGGVLGGGRPPSFSTRGVTYCLTQLDTYHWNGGKGATPGSIGLGGPRGAKVGSWSATGSSGQGGAANVNWAAHVPTSPTPVVINGIYRCLDSSSATWSQNGTSRGTGFCQVYVRKAMRTSPTSAGGSGTRTTTTIASATKCKGAKLSLTATPNVGKEPLTVTFRICSPKTVQWRIDYGDGRSKVAIGSPPPTISHVYTRDGSYRPRLITIATPSATASSTVVTSVWVGPPLISLSATPAAGAVPLRVTLGLATTVTHITTWMLDFGDGTHTGGPGKPPTSVSHTYAKNGTYRATFSVKPGAYALVYTVAQITAGSGTPPILGVSATPTSGSRPLAVSFTIGTTIPGVITSWVIKFGDGYQAQGRGRPPATVAHTYAKKGVYLAYLIVAQQQKYGGVQYIVPRGGLVIHVN